MLVVQWQEHAEALNQQIAQLQQALEAAQAAAGDTASLETQLAEVCCKCRCDGRDDEACWCFVASWVGVGRRSMQYLSGTVQQCMNAVMYLHTHKHTHTHKHCTLTHHASTTAAGNAARTAARGYHRPRCHAVGACRFPCCSRRCTGVCSSTGRPAGGSTGAVCHIRRPAGGSTARRAGRRACCAC